MNAPKLLKPTMRERNRYLAFVVLSEASQTIDRKIISDTIWGSLLRLHGEVGASKTSLWVMDWDPGKKCGILKVSHHSVDVLRSSCAMVRELNGKKAIINITHVSGTLKSAREHIG